MQKEIMKLAEIRKNIIKKKKHLSTPDLSPQGKRENKQSVFPDLLPVIELAVTFTIYSLVLGWLLCQTFQSRK